MLALQSVFALASPCKMSSSEHSAMSSMLPMHNMSGPASAIADTDHGTHHQMLEAPASDAPSSNCCDGGYCSQNGCMPPGALIDGLFGTAVDLVITPTVAAIAATPHWAPSSLYRPPSA